uniref:peroxisomal 2,4-dienoyl-CoA reductase-like n=1 Tax=Styela clava TaxID=7725 RepID=UPI0019395F26|nr:peroxisomal 2,4-dienoyl-CoA reductase-like [Styela clava]
MLQQLKLAPLQSFLFQGVRPINRSFNLQPKLMMSTRPRNSEIPSDDCLPSYEYVFKQDLLKGQVAFITGGGSGIGFRIAEVFMRHGCDTAIASRRLEKCQESAKKLEDATGQRCLPLSADVRNPKDVQKTIDKIVDNFGKINILVNSAAGNFLSDVENLSYNAFKTVIDIDTIGTFNCSKAVYEKYFKKNGGNIINISATLHYKGDAMQTHAGSAKAAIDAMTRHMAVEWGGNGVRINCISPGPIDGTVGMKKLGGESSLREQLENGIPLQRMGQKCEIADTAVFLVSNAASYVTGAVLVVDGGSWMTAFNNFSMIKKFLANPKL